MVGKSSGIKVTQSFSSSEKRKKSGLSLWNNFRDEA